MAFAAMFLTIAVELRAQNNAPKKTGPGDRAQNAYSLGTQAYNEGNYAEAQRQFYFSWIALNRVSTALMLAKTNAALFKQSKDAADAQQVLAWLKSAENARLTPPPTDEQRQTIRSLRSQFSSIVASLDRGGSSGGATASALDADDVDAKPAKKPNQK